ncbi:MAG: cadherin-like domain-containing protein, partial [Campylobacterota bacterium]|nr:cadherin-like domain-containing protein [Campylobacterota bacterium]
TIVNGEIQYTPNANFFGTDTISLSVDDGAGGVITENITVTINSILDEAEVVNTMPSYSQDIQAITNKIMNTNSDTYMEFGYIATDPQDISTATDTYFTGDITPSEVISGYITNSQTASYTGGVSAIVDGTASTGTVNLDVNFGTQNFTGNINVPEGDWQAAINSGTVNPYGLSSNDISTKIESNTAMGSVPDISGS